MIRTTIFAATIVLAGCGGGSGGASCGDCGSPAAPLAAPQNLDAQTDDDQVTVTWDSVSGADAYQVYVSSDPALEIENYATYDHSEWIQDVESPLVWTIPKRGHNYTVAVTATAGDRESDPARTGVVAIFEVSPSDPSIVIDHSAGLEWKRCSEGQTWDAAASTCLGDPARYQDTSVAGTFPVVPDDQWGVPDYWGFADMASCRPAGEPANGAVPRHDIDCDAAIDHFFPNYGVSYPPYFVRSPDHSGLCGTSFAYPGVLGCSPARGDREFMVILIRNK